MQNKSDHNWSSKSIQNIIHHVLRDKRRAILHINTDISTVIIIKKPSTFQMKKVIKYNSHKTSHVFNTHNTTHVNILFWLCWKEELHKTYINYIIYILDARYVLHSSIVSILLGFKKKLLSYISKPRIVVIN